MAEHKALRGAAGEERPIASTMQDRIINYKGDNFLFDVLSLHQGCN
jgi:hypothetical protein